MQEKQFDIKKIGKIPKEKCFICQHQIDEADIIFEDEKHVAFLDLYPPTNGYTIFAVKRHVEDVTELSEDEYLKFQKILFQISRAIKKSFNPKRICLLNSGSLLSHWHFHLIPLYSDNYFDELRNAFLKKSVLEMSKEERVEIAAKIKTNIRKQI